MRHRDAASRRRVFLGEDDDIPFVSSGPTSHALLQRQGPVIVIVQTPGAALCSNLRSGRLMTRFMCLECYLGCFALSVTSGFLAIGLPPVILGVCYLALIRKHRRESLVCGSNRARLERAARAASWLLRCPCLCKNGTCTQKCHFMCWSSLFVTLCGAAGGMKGRGSREIPEKTRRPAVSSGTILRCENPGNDLAGNEPDAPWFEVGCLTTTPPRPLVSFEILGSSTKLISYLNVASPACLKLLLEKTCLPQLANRPDFTHVARPRRTTTRLPVTYRSCRYVCSRVFAPPPPPPDSSLFRLPLIPRVCVFTQTPPPPLFYPASLPAMDRHSSSLPLILIYTTEYLFFASILHRPITHQHNCRSRMVNREERFPYRQRGRPEPLPQRRARRAFQESADVARCLRWSVLSCSRTDFASRIPRMSAPFFRRLRPGVYPRRVHPSTPHPDLSSASVIAIRSDPRFTSPSIRGVLVSQLRLPPDKLVILDDKGSHVAHYTIGPYNEGTTADVLCIATGGEYLLFASLPPSDKWKLPTDIENDCSPQPVSGRVSFLPFLGHKASSQSVFRAEQSADHSELAAKRNERRESFLCRGRSGIRPEDNDSFRLLSELRVAHGETCGVQCPNRRLSCGLRLTRAHTSNKQHYTLRKRSSAEEVDGDATIGMPLEEVDGPIEDIVVVTAEEVDDTAVATITSGVSEDIADAEYDLYAKLQKLVVTMYLSLQLLSN
ncbi:hypothetical protein PR048_025465 [Dryococelus australis]|uniref:Uncharacterized protein n=1 Tax=Dryococelus australis TaxID=614101 RepID=A0ABQ9GRH5_9NEOP|nr:hypothetical protein PR048_025465 [Dryococelus australis]